MLAEEYQQLVEFLGRQFTKIEQQFTRVDQQFVEVGRHFTEVGHRFDAAKSWRATWER